MSDRFTTEMNIEELMQYIRRTPKAFANELPDKLEKWINARMIELDHAMKETHIVSEDPSKIKERQEYIFRIVERHAPHTAMDPKLLVDYAIEITDEFLTQTNK